MVEQHGDHGEFGLEAVIYALALDAVGEETSLRAVGELDDHVCYFDDHAGAAGACLLD